MHPKKVIKRGVHGHWRLQVKSCAVSVIGEILTVVNVVGWSRTDGKRRVKRRATFTITDHSDTWAIINFHRHALVGVSRFLFALDVVVGEQHEARRPTVT